MFGHFSTLCNKGLRFVSNYFTTPNNSPILRSMEGIQHQHNMIINHILLIYKHYLLLPRNYESLNLIGLKKVFWKDKF